MNVIYVDFKSSLDGLNQIRHISKVSFNKNSHPQSIALLNTVHRGTLYTRGNLEGVRRGGRGCKRGGREGGAEEGVGGMQRTNSVLACCSRLQYYSRLDYSSYLGRLKNVKYDKSTTSI